MTHGLLDTSVFIAGEGGRQIGELPDRAAVSVVTVGELQLGVLLAADSETRARRGRTLELARGADPIPVSEAVMGSFARLVAGCRKQGTRVRVLDALIASTAIEHGLPVYTQDEDFEAMARIADDLQVVPV